MADKLLVGSVTVTLGVQGLLSPYIVALVLARDVCLVAGVALIRHRTREPGSPFFSLQRDSASFQITPSTASKVRPLCRSVGGRCELRVTLARATQLTVASLRVTSQWNTFAQLAMVATCLANQWGGMPGDAIVDGLRCGPCGGAVVSHVCAL